VSHTFDATIIAKGAPNRTQAGIISMCAIAVSPEFGLVRLYPLTFEENADVRVWTRVRVHARRSKKDSRKESWRIESTEVIGKIDDAIDKSQLLDQCVLKSGTCDPIKYQNSIQASIAVIKSSSPVGCALEPRDDTEKATIDEDETWWGMTQCEHPFKPYLLWTSIQGGKHRTHIVAQEAYVGMAKNASAPFRIYENMHVGDPDYQHWLVLGNMKDRRNVWVCPHVHRLKKTDSLTNLSLLMSDGENDAWPYLSQEAVNARDAGPQMAFRFTT
jgi:hypothetical protein